MEGPDFPIALGVIRDVEAPTYDDAVVEQIEDVKSKKKYIYRRVLFYKKRKHGKYVHRNILFSLKKIKRP